MSGPESPTNVTNSVPMLMQLISQIRDFQHSVNKFENAALTRFAAIEARQDKFEKKLSELQATILPPQRPPSPLIDIMTVDSPPRHATKHNVIMVPAELKERPAPERVERIAKSRRVESETKTQSKNAAEIDDGVVITSSRPQPIASIAQVAFPKLKNFANTCHINSAINLVFHLPSLVKLLESDNHSNAIKISLRELYKVYRSGNEESINKQLENFINVLVPHSKELQQANQKDADVALRYILNALDYTVPYREAKYGWQFNRHRYVYRFEDRSETIFPVQMTAKTLSDMFQKSFFSIYENNDETMRWNPSSHDTPIKEWKRRTYFTEAPAVLFINYLRGDVGGRKVLDNIPFEKEFSLPIHMENSPAQVGKGKEKIEESDQVKYRLAGVIMHLGMNMRGGHFCNYLPKDAEWYRVSDDASQLLKKLEDNSANKNEVSYILAYEKIVD